MERSVFLDLIRIIALGIIMYSHATVAKSLFLIYPEPIDLFFGYYIVSFAEIGVILFIILSGFLLQSQYFNHKISLFPFLKNRFLKFYPTFVACFFIVLFSYFFIISPFQDFFNPLQILCELTMFCFAFSGVFPNQVLATSWFFLTIFGGYLFFPFLSPLMQKHPFKIFFMVSVIALTTRILFIFYNFSLPLPFPSGTAGWVKVFPIIRLFEFSFGMFLSTKIGYSSTLFLNKLKFLKKPLAFLSNITFPLFLIHIPIFNILWLSYLTFIIK